MDRPSIAVLPFVNLSKDPEQEYFADGIVEDIISALSRFRSFLVIARNTTFTYKGRSVNVPQIGRELGVRYVLEGSVRRSGERIRITAQLIDAATGMHMWAEHYDGVVADVFDLQDQITASVVGSIEPSIRAAEIERARRKRPDNLDAYDLVMRALPYVWSLEYGDNAKRRSCSRRLCASIPIIHRPCRSPRGAAGSASSTTGRRISRKISARHCALRRLPRPWPTMIPSS